MRCEWEQSPVDACPPALAEPADAIEKFDKSLTYIQVEGMFFGDHEGLHQQ
ncbi:hypothetical protein B0G82_4838 [Paraburkholderia sp. BL17N1]|nr:hypothetical protein B0G82_4838 [Paraburkholderia sp. BL17N1]